MHGEVAPYKNAHKFQKIIYSGIIPFVCAGKEEIHKYMQYKVFMTLWELEKIKEKCQNCCHLTTISRNY